MLKDAHACFMRKCVRTEIEMPTCIHIYYIYAYMYMYIIYIYIYIYTYIACTVEV
jgi:hypothetical protein